MTYTAYLTHAITGRERIVINVEAESEDEACKKALDLDGDIIEEDIEEMYPDGDIFINEICCDDIKPE